MSQNYNYFNISVASALVCAYTKCREPGVVVRTFYPSTQEASQDYTEESCLGQRKESTETCLKVGD